MPNPAGQSCASCYVYINGECRREAPRGIGLAAQGSIMGRSTFAPVDADHWCFDGIDKVTMAPFTSPPSPSAIGSFTCSAGASTTVAAAAVTADSLVILTPTNADAITLLTTTRLQVSNNAGVGFVLTYFGGAVAVGTETFAYQISG